MHRALLLLGMTVLASACNGGAKTSSPDADAAVTSTPGSSLTMTIYRAGVAEGHAFADFRITDADGSLRETADFKTQWTLAVLTPDPVTGASSFSSYITKAATGTLGDTAQPTSETTGTYAKIDGDATRYTFAIALPAGFSTPSTHRIGAWTYRPVDGDAPEVANATYDFVPAGGVPVASDVVAMEACNGCHSPLAVHGGYRREVKLCVTCHTTQLVDPNREDPAVPGTMNPLDLTSLVHRIHTGVDLPTLVAAQAAGLEHVAYDVIGYMNSDSIFAETVLGSGRTVAISGVVFPQDLRNCATCHQQAPAAEHWKSVVSQRACASCHDSTWFGDPTVVPALHVAHPGGPMQSDAVCGSCHVPDGVEYDLSISGAHTTPARSTEARGLVLGITKVSGVRGDSPLVFFTVENGDGSGVDLASLDRLVITISGPTTDYSQVNNIGQDVRAAAQPVGDGSWRYQFVPRGAKDAWSPLGPVIPSSARGTFSAGIEGRRVVTLPSDMGTFEEGGNNDVAYFSVDDSDVVPRRKVVEVERCNACHQELRAHGNLRTNTEYCVMCHAPDQTDWGSRPKTADRNTDLAATIDHIEERSVRFSRLIHSIHKGDELDFSVPFAVYGFKGSLNRFDDIRFPGDLARCETCHAEGTYTIDAIPATSVATRANQSDTIVHHGTAAYPASGPEIPVIQSVCLSCHDTATASAHVALETTATGNEACAVCHGEGRPFAVTAVHAHR